MPSNALLQRMLDRLYGAILSGPALNCRPHSSRQRLDFCQLPRLDGRTAQEILASLLGRDSSVKLSAKIAEPPAAWFSGGDLNPEEAEAVRAWKEQQATIHKLKVIAADAAEYQQDTGVSALFVGFPVLSFPPRFDKERQSKRILAPIALIPIDLEVRSGRAQSVTISCAENGVDRVIPNTGLLAWVEKQTGHRLGDLFSDEEGVDPWREINELVSTICGYLELPVHSHSANEILAPIPKADDDDLQRPGILSSAILGLFPLSNQGLIRDTEQLIDTETVEGPLASFTNVAQPLWSDGETRSDQTSRGSIHDTYLVSAADPCQTRAVRLARTAAGLVVHGPPGTGKSQTITNIIGDHLARGQRVLFVCDKRAALDVVRYRLESIGLGELCAVVHDPQRDQKSLYMAIRNQLDGLTEARSDNNVHATVERLNSELKDLHLEISRIDTAVKAPVSGTKSLHDLVGEWLAVRRKAVEVKCAFSTMLVEELHQHERLLAEIWTRAYAVGYRINPWLNAAGLSLKEFLSRAESDWRLSLEELTTAAARTDEIRDPDFVSHQFPLSDTAQHKRALATRLVNALEVASSETVSQWAGLTYETCVEIRSKLAAYSRQRGILLGPLQDPELAQIAQQSSSGHLTADSADLGIYLQIARRWYGFVFLKRRKLAADVLKKYGLALTIGNAEQCLNQIEFERARRSVHQFLTTSIPVCGHVGEDANSLAKTLKQVESLLELFAPQSSAERELLDKIRPMTIPPEIGLLADRLLRSAEHAQMLEELTVHLGADFTFSEQFRSDTVRRAAALEPIAPSFAALMSKFQSLENLLRLKLLISELPPELQCELPKILMAADEPECWQATLVARVLESHISRVLSAVPEDHRIDSQYYSSTFERYRSLTRAKANAVRNVVRSIWLCKQQQRLLASTGTRLNSAGAELRRRFFLRGTKAMRLRQVLAAGAGIEGGDPLFDLRPVWMASPETVAQIFSRIPIFDVLIFDEASQCRLEEALPVMTRAKRVVIAGDPKQLPPTRFFESNVANSEQEEPSDEQGWFEVQQGETEDLLTASLNLEIEQSFLDVHYRSRNADLIVFSNQNFYDARLQAIPAHPSHKAKLPPIRLIQVSGTYVEQTNRREAEEVVRLVRLLLEEERPPSIGIACFNLPQRDLISDLLAETAETDSAFAQLYHQALHRRGSATFEGLFIKNLENVQGDERDHIIISTTYGQDPQGRFRRNFGPLNRAGGGRRLNVLVTRAREAVHLVTSIPPAEYHSFPVLSAGQSPNGAHLLFSYLNFAERLAQLYVESDKSAGPLVSQPEVHFRETRTPSLQAQQLAKELCEKHQLSSEVPWGNEGFCVDIAVQHPRKPDDVTVGIICDGTRYPKADDPVEWDVFRTEILQSQGWKLVRTYSPAVFRDPRKILQSIREQHEAMLIQEEMSAESKSAAVN